jgi:ankyrin repeat protein
VSRYGPAGKAGAHGATTGLLFGGDFNLSKSCTSDPLSAARARRLDAQLKIAESSNKTRGRSYKKSDLGGSAAAGLQGILESGQRVEDVFKMLDADGSGLLDQEELMEGMKKMGTVLNDDDLVELKGLLGLSKTKDMQVDLEQFKNIVDQTPSSSGGTETGAWLTQLHLYQSFIPIIDAYEYLPEADDDLSSQDKLAHVRGLQEEQVRQIVADASEKIVEKLLAGVKALRDLFDERRASSKAMQSNGKFSGDAGGGQITMVYGKLDEFHDGLESIIGLPNPRVFEGMRIDHCERADSDDDFTAWNYGITTKPSIEWEYVVNPDPNKDYFGEATPENSHGRTRQTVAELMAKDKIIEARLSKEELIGLRLYTGPMFVKYNCILRGFPKAVVDGLKGNRYVTTLHAIVSGIRKLGRVEPIPEGRCVYRGLGGMLLPTAFHKPDELGCMGGVERAFMSTTTKRAIAVQYSGNKTPTIFQISIGQIDMGASLNILSQYAGEEEILMPPLSNLEVVGPKWYEEGCMVIPLRINVNLKSSTIDEIVMRRKLLHKNMLGNLISEAQRVLDVLSQDASLTHGSVSQRIIEQTGTNLGRGYVQLQARHDTHTADDFNDDLLYKTLIVEGVEEKARVVSMHRSVFFRVSLLLKWAGDAKETPLGFASLKSDQHLSKTKMTRKMVELDHLLLGGLSPGKVAAVLASARLQLPTSCQECDPPKGGPTCICALFGRIRFLDLSNNGIGEEGARILADALKIENIGVPESLILDNNRLGAGGVEIICLTLQSKLEATGGSVKMVMKGVQYTELVKLDLARNNMTEKGMQIVVESLGLITTLHTLNLRGNSIRDYNSSEPEASPLMQMLLTMTTLTDLDISQNDVSHDMAEHLVVTIGKRCQQITVLNGREVLWATLRTERQRREKRDYLRRTCVEADGSAFMFRPSARDESKCEFCTKSEHMHFSSFRFCYLPVYTESEEEADVCLHCRQPQKAHRTSHNFCFDCRQREAIEEARRKNMIKESLEEDVGKGQTPLIRAAENGEEDAVYLLLVAGANLEQEDRSCQTALLCAAGAKHPASMNLLLAAGAKITKTNLRGQTSLHVAILSSQELNATELLAAAGGPDLVARQDKDGKTCLHCAAEKGMQSLALSLLSQGGLELLRKCTVDGRTALHFAAEKGLPQLCKKMLEIGGVEVAKMVSSHGRTCLHDVAQMLWWAPSKPSDSTDEHNQLRHEQMQDLCLRLIQELPTQSLAQEDESKCTALTYCAGSSLEDACLRILDRLQGAKIKVKVQLENCEEHEVEHEMLERVTKLRSLDGRTALHWASAKGLLSVVQRLAAVGGKELLSMQGADGRTCLHWAAGAGHEDVCCALITVGGQELVLLASRDGWSALSWAVVSGLEKAAGQMIDVGGKALLMMRDRYGMTALHRAAWRRGENMERLCIQMVHVGGSELVVLIDKDKRSVLHIAASGCLSQLCHHVIDTVPSVIDIQDSEGRTALHMAAAGGPPMESVCRALIKKGGLDMIMARMTNGRTALHLAAERGMIDLCVQMVHRCMSLAPVTL